MPKKPMVKSPKRKELEDYEPGASKAEVRAALGKAAQPVKKPEK